MSMINFLKKLRDRKEVSMTAIERKCGIAHGTLCHVMKGRRTLQPQHKRKLKRHLAFYGYSEKNNLEEQAA